MYISAQVVSKEDRRLKSEYGSPLYLISNLPQRRRDAMIEENKQF